MTMIHIIPQKEIERRIVLALHGEMILREERLLHAEMMIFHHHQMEKESLIMGSPRRLRGQLDEGTEEGGVMAVMEK